MTRKAIRPVRRYIGANFEHDLVAVAQDERAGVASAAHTVEVHPHRPVEAEHVRPREPSPPHSEDVAERGAAREVDDSGGIEGPHAGAAARSVHATERLPRATETDRGGHDHDAAVREQLHMRSCTAAQRRSHASRVHRGTGVVLRSNADRRRRERNHRLHGIALVALVAVIVLAGCGGSASSPTISVQPARQFQLTTHIIGAPAAGRPAKITFSIQQPDGSNLTKFRHGAGPHTGVHVIYVRNDLGAIVHHHPHIAADGSFTDTVAFPSGGPYRVVIDVYPQQTTPQPNFQLFTRVRVAGAYKPQPLPAPTQNVAVDGYRIALHNRPRLHAIQAAFLSFTVTRPDGTPAHFTPWFGALAHAIFFRAGTLDYFHTHVCAPGASGCTSAFGRAKVTGTSSTPGKLTVGVLVPVAGTWRLFLQCLVDGHVLTAPFTLHVR
jgi:hypothetical protein